MRFFKGLLTLLGLLIVVALAVAFVSHNDTEITVDLLFVPLLQSKQAYWLLGFFITGGLAGMLCTLPSLLREKSARARIERRMQSNSKIISDYSS